MHQMYSIENYQGNIPFNKQYDEIHNFLQTAADNGYNEHFHWERFDHESSDYIKVFAIKDGEYTAHCGVWYHGGDTAYIEPVATVPEHRGKGLGRAVVYEAINRAKERGAKRAIVLSEQKFYIHLGMTKSSEVSTWVKNIEVHI